MCGIAGFVFTPNATKASAPDAVRRMTARMSRRGPDAEGLWPRDGVVLGHRRLAILDLDARANQPMVSTDGRYAIVFNGKIDNFCELRRTLEENGESFRSHSDTEVVLAAYREWGTDCLSCLNSMFASALYDGQ